MTLRAMNNRPPVRDRVRSDFPPTASFKHSSIEAALIEALARYGVAVTPRVTAEPVRFSTPDKPHKRNGWYRILSPQVAVFGIWHLDVSEVVTLRGANDPEAAA